MSHHTGQGERRWPMVAAAVTAGVLHLFLPGREAD